MSSESPLNFADLIPLPEDSDPEEVATALETAQIFAGRDPKEALRWLRRASEAASDAGRDNRSLALARAAADLAPRLSSPAPAPAPEPPAVAPPPPSAAAAEPENAQPTPPPSLRPPPPSERRSALPTPPPKPSVRPSAPSAAAVSSVVTSAPENPLTPAPPSAVSRPPSAEAPSRPSSSLTPSPARSVGKSRPPEKPAKPDRAAKPEKPSHAQASPSLTPAAPSVRPPKPTYTTPQALLGSEGSQVIERLIREGRAETVSVKRSARDPSLFVVRTGASQGLGSRKALIVLLEDAPDFFSDEQPEFTN